MSSESKNEGRQSPPPESQTGPQLHEPPASGQGTDNTDNKDQTNQDQLKALKTIADYSFSHIQNLTSNPPGPMDASLKEKFAKGFTKE
ncbi:hypothetical protein F4824DRAFT_502676 [Ustulina deusta]|nr:hypothetical protein F4824DRAFT_502676 [Ustulina deusta]